MFNHTPKERLLIKCLAIPYVIASVIYLIILFSTLSELNDQSEMTKIGYLGPFSLFETHKLLQSDGSSQLNFNFLAGTFWFTSIVDLVAITTFWLFSKHLASKS